MALRWTQLLIASCCAVVSVLPPGLGQSFCRDAGWPSSRDGLELYGLDELPSALTNPDQALIAYFSALSLAGRPNPFGSLRGGEIAIQRAYSYLSSELRGRLTRQQFGEELTGTVALRLLKLFNANYGDDTDPSYEPKYFVEIEKLEDCPTREGARYVFAYYWGLFVLTREAGAFRIRSWEMSPEDFVGPRGGHQLWRYDLEAEARQYVREKVFDSTETAPTQVTVLRREEDFAVVLVGAEASGHSVYLARLESGEWAPIHLGSGPVRMPGPPRPSTIKVAFVGSQEGRCGIYSMRGDGTQVTHLTEGRGRLSDPVWSSDGSKIAFVSDQTGSKDIYLVDADGSDLKQLTATPGNEHSPAWSPDSAHLAFAVGGGNAELRGLYTMDPRGGTPRRLTPSGMEAFCPGWSRDGRRIRFRSGRNLWAIDADGSNLERLAGVGEWDEEVAFSPDDRTAALIRFNAPRLPDGQAWDIYLLDLERNELRQVTFDGLEKHSLSWVNDQVLLFRLHKPGTDRLYWLDVSGGGMSPVAARQGQQLDGSAVTSR
jgi:dipeptidyl aminopeptidase/acylaminoacyl peptidase